MTLDNKNTDYKSSRVTRQICIIVNVENVIRTSTKPSDYMNLFMFLSKMKQNEQNRQNRKWKGYKQIWKQKEHTIFYFQETYHFKLRIRNLKINKICSWYIFILPQLLKHVRCTGPPGTLLLNLSHEGPINGQPLTEDDQAVSPTKRADSTHTF